MYYISAASTISHQPTFQNVGFSTIIKPLESASALISPDYKAFIEAGLLRRMSKILRMSVAAAKDCLAQAKIDQPGAIIVGTGLGCLLDTEKFLNNVLTIEGLLPPTSFIQSTHNTMAGQISLSIGNHGYNMTHTQNTISFENALLDAMLLLDEGEDNVLVGAADEAIGFLDEIADKLHIQYGSPFSSGASFFIISKEKSSRSLACVKDTRGIGLVENARKEIADFLNENDSQVQDLDWVLYSGIGGHLQESFTDFFGNSGMDKDRVMDYLPLSGTYPTISAFAMHLAIDKMNADPSLKNVLICNALGHNNLGLTLLQSIEA